MAAAHAGLGIEFDVRPAAGGEPIIFHDAILDRMTGETGLVESYSASELTAMPLNGGGRLITLDALLDAWPAKTPLLCEMKIDGATDPVVFARAVGDRLLDYQGPVAAMSFNPVAVRALPDGLMRGQLVDAARRIGERAFSAAMAAITPAHADYIACHTSDAEQARQRADELSMPVITWTVKDVSTSHWLKDIVDAQIFEGFDPALIKPH